VSFRIISYLLLQLFITYRNHWTRIITLINNVCLCGLSSLVSTSLNEHYIILVHTCIVRAAVRSLLIAPRIQTSTTSIINTSYRISTHVLVRLAKAEERRAVRFMLARRSGNVSGINGVIGMNT